jgi:hypothetical protein
MTTPAALADVPLVGLPFQIRAWDIQVVVECGCEAHTLLFLHAQQTVRCAACTRPYRLRQFATIMAQDRPTDRVGFSISVGQPGELCVDD